MIGLSPAVREFEVLRAGTLDYAAGLDLQHDLVARRVRGEIPDTLVLLDHPPVIVAGRGAKPGNVLASAAELRERGIEVVAGDRGGDVTFHCPGQLVGYPIVDLTRIGRDVHEYLRRLEEALIRALAGLGVSAGRFPGRTGVWAGGEKIASIGIAVRKWVAFHGFALNVSNDLDGFALIHPCGMPGVTMTSVSRRLGRRVPLAEAAAAVSGSLAEAVYA